MVELGADPGEVVTEDEGFSEADAELVRRMQAYGQSRRTPTEPARPAD